MALNDPDLVVAMAKAIWRTRELRFPSRIRRMQWDDLDEVTGTKAAVLSEAQAALDAITEMGRTIVTIRRREPRQIVIEEG